MNDSVTHTRRHRHHRLTALVMAFAYLAMLCLPLISFAMAPKGASQPKQCTGDCSVCGCSPAASAAKTCCCARKQQQLSHAHEAEDDDTPDCCKKEHSETKETVIACGCPCGTDSHDDAYLQNLSETIPCRFCTALTLSASATAYPIFPQRLTSRHVEPPDPPPRLQQIS